MKAELFDVVGVYIREFAENFNIAFRINLPIHKIKVDGHEVLEAKLFDINNLPDEASPRTQRIIRDAISGQQSKVVIFRDINDSGSILGNDKN